VGRTIVFSEAGYRYVEGAFQYSAGVAAEKGFECPKFRNRRNVPK